MKDPAVLFYISDWLTSTSEMDSDCKGWYLNLILHNYDKGSLPNDIEKLAVLAGVKFSEFKRFEQVFEHVLRQKFKPIDEQRLSNLKAQTILKDRECFKDKRSEAGKKSYLMKFFAKNYNKQYKDKKIYNFVNLNIDTNIDTKNQTEIEHMFKHLFELYISENESVNKDEEIKEVIIPTLKEFGEFALEKKPMVDKLSVKLKYEAWVQNGWKDGNNNKIVNWKSKLLNTLDHLKETKITEQPKNRSVAL